MSVSKQKEYEDRISKNYAILMDSLDINERKYLMDLNPLKEMIDVVNVGLESIGKSELKRNDLSKRICLGADDYNKGKEIIGKSNFFQPMFSPFVQSLPFQQSPLPQHLSIFPPPSPFIQDSSSLTESSPFTGISELTESSPFTESSIFLKSPEQLSSQSSSPEKQTFFQHLSLLPQKMSPQLFFPNINNSFFDHSKNRVITSSDYEDDDEEDYDDYRDDYFYD